MMLVKLSWEILVRCEDWAHERNRHDPQQKDTLWVFLGALWNLEKGAWIEVHAPDLVLPPICPCSPSLPPSLKATPASLLGAAPVAEICIPSPGLADLRSGGR